MCHENDPGIAGPKRARISADTALQTLATLAQMQVIQASTVKYTIDCSAALGNRSRVPLGRKEAH